MPETRSHLVIQPTMQTFSFMVGETASAAAGFFSKSNIPSSARQDPLWRGQDPWQGQQLPQLQKWELPAQGNWESYTATTQTSESSSMPGADAPYPTQPKAGPPANLLGIPIAREQAGMMQEMQEQLRQQLPVMPPMTSSGSQQPSQQAPKFKAAPSTAPAPAGAEVRGLQQRVAQARLERDSENQSEVRFLRD